MNFSSTFNLKDSETHFETSLIAKSQSKTLNLSPSNSQNAFDFGLDIILRYIVQGKKNMLSYQCMRQNKKSKQQQHTNFPLEQKHWRRAQTRFDNIFDIPLINNVFDWPRQMLNPPLSWLISTIYVCIDLTSAKGLAKRRLNVFANDKIIIWKNVINIATYFNVWAKDLGSGMVNSYMLKNIK